MAVQWTKEQQKVIELRDTDILVSAAAGSGKTAVLVQRIIGKIMDENHPVNIDQLVIVTFTQAAAEEMRERIMEAIEKQSALHPQNVHLQRQKTRIHMANISTIHRFCKHIIQNHFQEINLEPSFRVGDTGEMALMRQDVLSEVFEHYYEEGREEFLQFTEYFAGGKDDEGVGEVVLQLYESAMSNPNPEQWLKKCCGAYQVKTCEQLMETEWMKALFLHLQGLVRHAKNRVLQAFGRMDDTQGCEAYGGIFSYYEALLEKLMGQADYQTWFLALGGFEHQKLPTGKRACPDVSVREELKEIRDELNKLLDDLKKKYFKQDAETVLLQFEESRCMMELLVEVTLFFHKQFLAEKRKNNLLDFHDLEHEALHILLDEDGNPTQTALEYAEYFDEIMIDEYQDSNLVQESLLLSVSKHMFGKHNVFMVGDSKQSIYRFRQARPELFLEKFHSYTVGTGQQQRIDLHKNFRSRREVLSGANYIFGRIMQEAVGGIAYDAQAALYPGREFEAPSDENAYVTELLVFDKKEKELVPDSIQYEAKIIAQRIKQLTDEKNGISVQDKKTGRMRPAQYRDIAVLLRSTPGYDTALMKELAAKDIPVHVLSKEGYFDTLEITTILNYLRIIDNPLQDIPLLSVLKSPIGRITDEELARIRIFCENGSIYDCIKAYAANSRPEEKNDGKVSEETIQQSEEDMRREEMQTDESLRLKLSEFLEQLQQFRKKMNEMPIHKFLCYIADETGYGDYIRLMPGGEQRRANMDMLIEKAAAFEQTSYLGVFWFIRYIEQLRKYKIEMGEASVAGENDNTVRIMTIHKSKGLEFPIVFVAGLGRGFNGMERRQKIVIHPRLGVGMDYVNLELRQKQKMLFKEALLQQNYLEELGEELRVLYVALTRAKEKLILSGGVAGLEKHVRQAYARGYRTSLSYADICGAGSFMDWLLCALAGHRDMQPLLDAYIEDRGSSWEETSAAQTMFPASFLIKEMNMEQMFDSDLTELASEERSLLLFDREKENCRKPLPEEVEKQLSYRYPYEKYNQIPVKVSVSELKSRKLSAFAEEEDSVRLLENAAKKSRKKPLPSFLSQEALLQEPEEDIAAVNRGNAYHKVFECLDFTCADTAEQGKEQLEQLYASGKADRETERVIRPQKIAAFAASPLGKRIGAAQRAGRLYREQPFVYAMPAKEIDPQWDSDQPVMIQGIIDVFFEEGDGLVLLDYKTDYLQPGQEFLLSERYAQQMKYYRLALSAIMNKPVNECLIYSVGLEVSIPL